MNFKKLCGICCAVVVLPLLAWADNPDQGTYSLPAADLYLSPLPETGLRVPPSGAINITPITGSSIPSPTFEATVAPVGEISNTLGCAGVGQGEFTSGLFNMPEVFEKFQHDVNSVLSKNLLSLNFVMPQTSALFDQMNSIGNQRYDQFQRGCNITPLQQDARQTYLQACIEKVLPERQTKIEEINKELQAKFKIPEDQIGPMAYAQAWEVCANQYVSNTTAMEVRSEKLTEFYGKMRKVERVDEAIRPLLCDLSSKVESSNDGCWIKFLIPQVKICLGNHLEGGCTEGEYGVKEPMISMQRLFDTMRFMMEDEIIARRVVSFTTQLNNLNIDASTRKLAAAEASLVMSTATLLRGTQNTVVGSELETIPEKSVIDYQLSYLSCKNLDVLNPIKQYQTYLKKRLEGNTNIVITDMTVLNQTTYEDLVKKMKLPDGEGGDSKDEDVKAVAALLQTSLGCTVNQSIPIFDPNITASLQTQCSAQDRSAFYTMAGYDVALTATRDVYRYMGLKLKQAYARLLTEAMLPVSDTTDTSVSPTLSPELNTKFAAVVKDVMIPYMENQVQRLDDLATTRGVFGQRVQEIYSNKGGCMTSSGGPGGGRGARRYSGGGGGGGGGGAW